MLVEGRDEKKNFSFVSFLFKFKWNVYSTEENEYTWVVVSRHTERNESKWNMKLAIARFFNFILLNNRVLLRKESENFTVHTHKDMYVVCWLFVCVCREQLMKPPNGTMKKRRYRWRNMKAVIVMTFLFIFIFCSAVVKRSIDESIRSRELCMTSTCRSFCWLKPGNESKNNNSRSTRSTCII